MSELVETGSTLLCGDAAIIASFYDALHGINMGLEYVYTFPCGTLCSQRQNPTDGRFFSLFPETFNIGRWNNTPTDWVAGVEW
ncbi:hypothetical protein BV22DRAFT_407771 [Leucogyrophana mollusca]|uniref:Uncharacterized protein n=1 Tax=Leucogyrophana mollusca TaxID=85980 RepID=A0ACB8BJ96_9AGAM|nr:hypothetical protein BV22DRAFT_407771 [Leucogyrophana mollusca]